MNKFNNKSKEDGVYKSILEDFSKGKTSTSDFLAQLKKQFQTEREKEKLMNF